MGGGWRAHTEGAGRGGKKSASRSSVGLPRAFLVPQDLPNVFGVFAHAQARDFTCIALFNNRI